MGCHKMLLIALFPAQGHIHRADYPSHSKGTLLLPALCLYMHLHHITVGQGGGQKKTAYLNSAFEGVGM